jgi:hypothetical protein
MKLLNWNQNYVIPKKELLRWNILKTYLFILKYVIKQCDEMRTSSQIISPRMGDIVDSGIGLPYRPASLCSQAVRYDNLTPESTLSPQSGTVNLATGVESPP